MQCTKGFYTEQRKLNYLDSVTCGVQIDTNLTEAKFLATVVGDWRCTSRRRASCSRGLGRRAIADIYGLGKKLKIFGHT